MPKRALPITMGAMMIALFGLMLLLERQTGGLLLGAFVLALPLPLTAYALQYGFRKSLPVFAAMCLISIFFGTFTTIFYACSQSIIGLVFGTMLHRRADPAHTLFMVMLLSVLGSVLNLILDMAFFGYDISRDVNEIMQVMNDTFSQLGGQAQQALELLTPQYMSQLFVLSLLFSGLVQGFLIYQLSLLLLRRLHFSVEKPRPLFEYYPPRALGIAGFFLFVAYSASLSKPLADPVWQNALSMLGNLGFIYLIAFGFVAVLLLVRVYLPRAGLAGGLIALAAMLLMPQALMLLRTMLSGFTPVDACRLALRNLLTAGTVFWCLAGVLACLPVWEHAKARFDGSRWFSPALDALTIVGLLLCLMQLASHSFQPFIYASF